MKINEAFLELCQECNLRCIHCYSDKNAELLSTEKIFLIIDKLKRLGVKELILLGGEPTLRKDLNDIVEYAITNIKGVNVQTNGTNKTFLSPYKCNVSISFEYPDKKQNDSIRKFKYGKGSAFEFAIRKIKSLTNDKVTRYTLYNDTDILKCLIMAEMYECNSVFVPLMPSGLGKELINKIPEDEKIAEALYTVREFNKKSRFHHEVQIPQNYLFDKDLYLKNATKFRDRKRICGAGINRIFIKANGVVTPCPYIDVNCGNILRDNLTFIKNKLQDFNRKMEKKKLSGNCAKCFFGSVCNGGCLVYSISKPTKSQFNCPVNFLINNYKEVIR